MVVSSTMAAVLTCVFLQEFHITATAGKVTSSPATIVLVKVCDEDDDNMPVVDDDDVM